MRYIPHKNAIPYEKLMNKLEEIWEELEVGEEIAIIEKLMEWVNEEEQSQNLRLCSDNP